MRQIKSFFLLITFFSSYFFGYALNNSYSTLSRDGANIIAHSYELSDDGVLINGETCDLTLTIINVGDASTNAPITITLTSDNNLLTIVKGTALYNGLAPGQLLSLEDGFTISAAPNVSNGQLFTVNVLATSGDDSWQSSIDIVVYRPTVTFLEGAWYGTFNSGNTIDVMVSFQNTGGVIATNATATLSSTVSSITINNPTQSIGNLYPTGIGTFVFNISLGTNLPSNIPFSVDFTTENGITLTESFTISNGCNVKFDLFDTYGDGWNGAALNVSFSNGTPMQTMTISSGSSASYTLEMANNVTVTVAFVSGSWNSECSFKIYYVGGDMIYQSSGTPSAGVVTTFTTACGEEPINCDPVSNLSATVSGLNVILTWNSTATNEYQVKRDGIIIAQISTNTYTDMNVEPGEHYYSVLSDCGNQVSAPKGEFVTVYAPCIAPENLTAIASENRINLSWNSVETANTYNIYRNGILIHSTSFTIYNDRNLEIGNYCYWITAICIQNEETSPSNEACETITSVQEKEETFQIFPNPANSLITIKGKKIKAVKIYNTLGQVVANRENIHASEISIDVSNLDNGIYMFHIFTEEDALVLKKIIVSK